MVDARDFRYVDFASPAQPGFRNNVVRVVDVPGLVDRYGRADCYCTYFQFDGGLPEYVKQNHGSVAGYGGPCYAGFLTCQDTAPLPENSSSTCSLGA
jgi:hypothetical protein